jgi:thioredoxin-like negative regulator of GroEL
VLKVDTERYLGLASQFNVRSIPNFAAFSPGHLQFQQARLVDATTMESWLTRGADPTVAVRFLDSKPR